MCNRFMSRPVQWWLRFRADEDGAVTTDFVVLTASCMMLGAAHVRDVALASKELGAKIDSCLAEDIGDLLVGGDPQTHLENLRAAATACNNR